MTDSLRAMLTVRLGDPDPVVRAHARWRLELADREPQLPAVVRESRTVADSIRLMRLAQACRWRSQNPACGCWTCGIKAATVTTLDCWACVERYGES